MIKAVTVTNHLGESLRLELMKPDESGLLISNVEGLGPVTATINTTDVSMMDGALFNSARLGTRNIVLSLMFLWNPLIEDSRLKTYQYFPVKKRVKLEFETDRRTCYSYGYVESNEPEIFSEQESTQISIICPDPFFYKSGDVVNISLSSHAPLFEFPFENPNAGTPIGNHIEFGDITPMTDRNIYYEGEVDIGITVNLFGRGSVGNVSIYNVTTGDIMTIDVSRIQAATGQAFGNGDQIILNTIPGQKSARLLRSGVYYNIMNSIAPGSKWFVLQHGDNQFSITAVSGIQNLEASIEYRIAYQGV